MTQLGNTFRRNTFVTNDQQTQDVIQYIRRNLLFCITPSLIRIAMALYNQTINTQVHRLLTQRSNQLSTTTDMTGVANHGKVGITTTQLNGNLPHRKVAVNLLIIRREATVNGTQSLYTRLVDSFQGTNPQFNVGINRVFHEDRHIHSF